MLFLNTDLNLSWFDVFNRNKFLFFHIVLILIFILDLGKTSKLLDYFLLVIF